ncbi:hypothetical protein BV898_08243 [Hypsibius exemplaris]|uniref:Uncharacterized protein n=1 Tax=Hypsibius exemplaris TaxID=2072580 RepID=A0A1W0WQY6_HYPEX|nr:hypothetical protein BV898_08243 [Hypsibius exemplaris]
MVHLDRLMSCIRWIHMTPEDIVLVKHIDPVLFAEPAVSNKAALGQWQRDLLRRGIPFASTDLPSNRCE